MQQISVHFLSDECLKRTDSDFIESSGYSPCLNLTGSYDEFLTVYYLSRYHDVENDLA